MLGWSDSSALRCPQWTRSRREYAVGRRRARVGQDEEWPVRSAHGGPGGPRRLRQDPHFAQGGR